MRKIELNTGEIALVDESDYKEVSRFKWFLHSGGYATTKHEGKFLYMHRLVNNTPEGMLTDHINGNKLDNRKINLRTCTTYQNMQNSKRKPGEVKYRGVTKYKNSGRFQSRIKINGKHVHLGIFDSKEEAALAYNLAAEKYHGEFAKLNEGVHYQFTVYDFLEEINNETRKIL